ncbi:hypothetical protein [Microbacterium suwonense]|uniref:FAD-binding FR-type domain-containing protein n=1 Tax=Microbacterium suwonense TaxID=683047 RepID=A0ABM8FW60_9MICO|nr:hypothetical protein [Microbacterium suwonense]BDZ39904.1 hypothetical protein GCM10025863_25180 [Microbacterium suwonense]
MPKAPSIVGRIVESALGRPTRVLRVAEPAPGFLHLDLRAEPPAGGWQPGHEVQVRVTRTEARRYTVRRVEEPDRIHVLAALETGGPGALWLRGLRPDAEMTLLAARHVPLRQHGRRRLHLGDGSALGTFDALTADQPDPLVAVEASAESVPALAREWPGFRFVPAGGSPGDTLQRWLDSAIEGGALAGIDGALLLGHAQSLQRQRRALVDSEVLDRRSITTKPYWATGRVGL